MRITKRWLSVVVFILILSFASITMSCESDSKAIEDVTTEFVTAYQNQQYSTCLVYLSNRLRNSEGDQNLINRLQTAKLFPEGFTLGNVDKPTVDKTKATVLVVMVGPLNLTSKVELSLIKEDNVWKINDF